MAVVASSAWQEPTTGEGEQDHRVLGRPKEKRKVLRSQSKPRRRGKGEGEDWNHWRLDLQ